MAAQPAPPPGAVGGGSGVVPLVAIIRARVATGDGPPVRLLYSARSAEELITGASSMPSPAPTPGSRSTYTLTRQQPAEVVGSRAPHRRVDVPRTRSGRSVAIRSPYVCRADHPCGERGRPPRSAGLPARADSHRALRADRMTEMGIGIPQRVAVHGNRAAGALEEVFGVEITTALTTCGHCGASGPLGRFAATSGARHRPALPPVRRRADQVRRERGPLLARPPTYGVARAAAARPEQSSPLERSAGERDRGGAAPDHDCRVPPCEPPAPAPLFESDPNSWHLSGSFCGGSIVISWSTRAAGTRAGPRGRSPG